MILLGISLAFADAIPMAPECLPGATGRTSHSGQYCALTDESACLCFVEEQVACGGRRMYSEDEEPCMVDRKRVTGACEPDGSCAEGACAGAEACVTATPEPEVKPAEDPKPEAPAEAPVDTTPTSEDGCSHVPVSVPLAGALGLGLLVLASRSLGASRCYAARVPDME